MSKITKKDLEMRLQETDVNGKYKLAIWTDKADFLDKTELVPDLDKLLELVAFDEAGEIRFRRFCVDEEKFFVREIYDQNQEDGHRHMDQAQFLDIERVNDSQAKAIGAGFYHLPEPGAKKLVVRYYYRFDADGMAYVYDKRLVRFENGG